MMTGRGLWTLGAFLTVSSCTCRQPPPVVQRAVFVPRNTVTGGEPEDASIAAATDRPSHAQGAAEDETSSAPHKGASTATIESLIEELGTLPAPPPLVQASDLNRSEWWIANELGRRGEEALPALREGLKNADAKVRFGSAQALAWMPKPPSAAVTDLIEALGDSEDQVACVAAMALGRIGGKDSAVVPALAGKLGPAASDALRASAAAALGELGSAALPANTALLETLEPEVPEVPGDDLKARQARALQVRARETLKLMGPGLVTRLQQELTGESREARSRAVTALTVIGKPELAVAAMRAQLRSNKVVLRLDAARLLGTLGPSAKGAAPDLWVAFSATDPEVKTAAAEALVALGAVTAGRSEWVVAALMGGLLSESGTERVNAASALGQMGPAAKSATEPLANVAAHGDGDERRVAVDALGQIGPGAQAAADVLVEVCQAEAAKDSSERDPSFQAACLSALGKIIGATEAAQRVPPVETVDDATEPSH